MNNHKLQIASFQELQYELSKSGSIHIQSSDPYLAMKEFFKSFKFVSTAGALEG